MTSGVQLRRHLGCKCRLQLQPVVVSHVLRCLGLSWYPGPGHRPANAASLSMAPEPGTDYHQPSNCQNGRYLHSSASSRPTSSSTSAVLVTFCASRRRRKMYCGHALLCVCLCVCLSAAVRPHYCTDPDVTWGRGRGCP